ncbi:Ring u-box domain-containing protein [Mycena sanguinolenta]|uniref:Ring u-box domain-containing protein n=1 Tax=Mycena sanguinolenta TaxID=230812 RepID=A0A8H7DK59_9AGAR|nr:Ring u-box domain-containing protein [Mycena sanguinolenta]
MGISAADRRSHAEQQRCCGLTEKPALCGRKLRGRFSFCHDHQEQRPVDGVSPAPEPGEPYETTLVRRRMCEFLQIQQEDSVVDHARNRPSILGPTPHRCFGISPSGRCTLLLNAQGFCASHEEQAMWLGATHISATDRRVHGAEGYCGGLTQHYVLCQRKKSERFSFCQSHMTQRPVDGMGPAAGPEPRETAILRDRMLEFVRIRREWEAQVEEEARALEEQRRRQRARAAEEVERQQRLRQQEHATRARQQQLQSQREWLRSQGEREQMPPRREQARRANQYQDPGVHANFISRSTRPGATPDHIVTGLETALYSEWATTESDRHCAICFEDYQWSDVRSGSGAQARALFVASMYQGTDSRPTLVVRALIATVTETVIAPTDTLLVDLSFQEAEMEAAADMV